MTARLPLQGWQTLYLQIVAVPENRGLLGPGRLRDLGVAMML